MSSEPVTRPDCVHAEGTLSPPSAHFVPAFSWALAKIAKIEYTAASKRRSKIMMAVFERFRCAREGKGCETVASTYIEFSWCSRLFWNAQGWQLEVRYNSSINGLCKDQQGAIRNNPACSPKLHNQVFAGQNVHEISFDKEKIYEAKSRKIRQVPLSHRGKVCPQNQQLGFRWRPNSDVKHREEKRSTRNVAVALEACLVSYMVEFISHKESLGGGLYDP